MKLEFLYSRDGFAGSAFGGVRNAKALSHHGKGTGYPLQGFTGMGIYIYTILLYHSFKYAIRHTKYFLMSSNAVRDLL